MPRKSSTADAPTRRNLTAKVRNQITEMADEGKTVAVIASECGVSVAKVEATLAAAAQGKTLAEASAEALANGGTVAADGTPDVPPTAAKPKKAAKVTRSRREDGYDGKGQRLFGIREDGIDDLGTWGDVFSILAVDAYEKAHPDQRYTSYLACPARNTWLVQGAE